MNAIKNKFSKDILEIIETLAGLAGVFGMNLYFVGGLVRDLLMGCAIQDVDIVVEGNAIVFCSSAAVQGVLKIKSTHTDFKTVKTEINGVEIDFASTRQEEYPQSGCLPVVTNIGCPLKEDVSRRDFTINAIALDLSTFKLIDYLGGTKDLENKVLKITYDTSFIDDPTRILRGLDFRLRFGFELDEHTRKMQEEYLKNPQRCGLSYARVDLTLKKLFKNGNPEKAYEHIIQEKMYKIFTDTKPELNADELQTAREICGGSADIFMRALKNDFPDKTLTGQDSVEIYNFFKGFSSDDLTLYFAKSKDMRVLEFKNKLENVKIKTTGNDLIAMGFSEGKLIGEILKGILSENLKGQMTAAEEKQWVLSNYKSHQA